MRTIEIQGKKKFEDGSELIRFSLKDLSVGDKTKSIDNMTGKVKNSVLTGKEIENGSVVAMLWSESLEG